jgi:hypothetical protein
VILFPSIGAIALSAAPPATPSALSVLHLTLHLLSMDQGLHKPGDMSVSVTCGVRATGKGIPILKQHLETGLYGLLSRRSSEMVKKYQG